MVICFSNIDGSIVWALYSKTGGKNVKHSSVDSSTTIGAVSNIVIQIFKPAISNNFQEATTVLNTRQWDIVPSISFLTVLGCLPLVHVEE